MKLFTFLLLLSLGLVRAQNNLEMFNDALAAGDSLMQWSVLEKWESEDPTNAELFTSYFNFYYLNAKKELLVLSSELNGSDGLGIVDSSGKEVGYLVGQQFYDADMMDKAFAKINQGIQLYPNRLDMRFGKIYVLGVIENWEDFTKEIIATVHYSVVNNNAWTWTYHQPLDDGEPFFLQSIQDYQVTLFETGEDKLLKNMREIDEVVIKYYPNNLVSYCNIGTTYIIEGDYENGFSYLKQAENIDKKDATVLNNLAYAYQLSNQPKKAIKYYKKIIKYCDESEAEYAQEEIDALENKMKER